MPKTFNISIADKTINISTKFDETYNLCYNYITERSPDFEIVITNDDIRQEIEKSSNKFCCDNENLVGHLESLRVYRKIAEKFLEYDTLLFHGSAISVDGNAYLFTAKSGTGKSTHTRLWREYFGDRAEMVNDDKPMLKITDNGVFVCGTPWDGKHHLSKNISVPLKAVCILERSDDNHISEISKRDALPILLQQSFRSENVDSLQKVLHLVDKLGDNVKLYKLGCNMNIEAVRVAYNGMNNYS